MSDPASLYNVYRFLRRGKAPRLLVFSLSAGEPPGGAKLLKEGMTLSLAEAYVRRLERTEDESWRRREGIDGEPQA